MKFRRDIVEVPTPYANSNNKKEEHLQSKCSSWRHHPESDRGSGFCRPVPYRLAMAPCRKQEFKLNSCFHLWSGRRGSNSLPPPWQGGALPDELLPQKPHKHCEVGASDRNRTNDTGIFSPLLYQLSYRGKWLAPRGAYIQNAQVRLKTWRPGTGSNCRPPA